VPGSERAVHLVLDVLFENALSHGDGVVEVSTVHLGDRAALRVADEGRIEGSLGADAFEREVRSSQSTGSGIGLALARTIAESAGARLHLQSTEPTVFELTLPA
jgi:signal transduction histidine kinase